MMASRHGQIQQRNIQPKFVVILSPLKRETNMAMPPLEILLQESKITCTSSIAQGAGGSFEGSRLYTMGDVGCRLAWMREQTRPQNDGRLRL